ncbi:sulfotransferase family 2 domain-containing protein [Marixanthomonas ophiurae]|uniref:Sulfotransferase domain-containing protein n=1 Tax=Marixanthomonas ophiurae TaxID=387659 RepID=A0A3E1QD63_9FLAO|nr:sulfotransferase family 2 domain-containing protein [Marixanthomonas ophiurae]RFN60047.1 hypothetical protein DZ858_08360 [Marixanthomonas ophiurae]
MLITKNFVMLNVPKTGTTFSRTVIKKVYNNKYGAILNKIGYKLKILKREIIELKLPNIKMPTKSLDQHGVYSQIPTKYRNRPIVSVVRNPYSRFLSSYKFRSWANPTQLTVSKEIIKNKFPSFPNLNLDTYVDLSLEAEKTRLEWIKEGVENIHDLGPQTIQFVQFFFKNPEEAILKINEEYITSGAYRKDMADIRFLQVENLKDDLYNLLSECGFTKKELAFVKEHKKMNVTKSKTKATNKEWTEKALQYVTYRERFLFLILKDFGIEYQKPNLD